MLFAKQINAILVFLSLFLSECLRFRFLTPGEEECVRSTFDKIVLQILMVILRNRAEVPLFSCYGLGRPYFQARRNPHLPSENTNRQTGTIFFFMKTKQREGQRQSNFSNIFNKLMASVAADTWKRLS